MAVEFTKNQRNNSVACNGGYSYFFVKHSKKDPNVSFYTCEKFWDEDFRCLAKVIFIYKYIYFFQSANLKYLEMF